VVSPPHTVIEILDSPIELDRPELEVDYVDPTMELQVNLSELAIDAKLDTSIYNA